jgi:hypothetical protein
VRDALIYCEGCDFDIALSDWHGHHFPDNHVKLICPFPECGIEYVNNIDDTDESFAEHLENCKARFKQCTYKECGKQRLEKDDHNCMLEAKQQFSQLE